MVFSRYVKSRSDEQLRSNRSERKTTNCEPEALVGQDQPIVPCGLIAWSLFNDTYKFTVNHKPLDVNKSNIAWDSDRKHKFGSDVYPKNFQSGRLIGGAKLNSSIPVSDGSHSSVPFNGLWSHVLIFFSMINWSHFAFNSWVNRRIWSCGCARQHCRLLENYMEG